MPPWLSHVSSCQNKESKTNSSRYIQLSTVGLDNTPRNRTVVFRGWSDSYEMKIFTDRRSSKFFELNSNNNVEICWFFTKSKCQFRFRGTSSIDIGDNTRNEWHKLNDNSKSMWGWPAPGKKFIKDNNFNLSFDPSISLVNFVLLKINIFHVDQLLLKKPIHLRRKWIKKDKWIEERINP